MPDFDPLFSSVQTVPLDYKGNKIIRFDDLPFIDGNHFKFIFEKKNSEWRQGILLSVFGYFEIDGRKFKDRVLFWEDTAEQETVFTIFAEQSKRKHSRRLPPLGFFSIKNIWDWGNGTVNSWTGGAAMIVEEIENGRRYRCNDGHPDENFDDIVFTVQRIPQ